MFANNNDKLKQNAKLAFENTHNLLNLSLESFERIANLNFELTKNAVESTSDALKVLTTTTDVNTFCANANNIAKSSIENNIRNYREICEVVVASQNKFKKEIESQIQEHKQNLNLNHFFQENNFAKYMNNNAFGSFVSKINETMQNVTKMANHANELTKSNMQTVSATLESVVNTAKKAAYETALTTQKAAVETVNTVKKAATDNVTIVKNATSDAVATVISSANMATASSQAAPAKTAAKSSSGTK
jgi:phasin family protein